MTVGPEPENGGESERLKAVLNAISDPLMTVNRDGTIRRVNTAFSDHFGYTSDDLTGSHWSGILGVPGNQDHAAFVLSDLDKAEGDFLSARKEIEVSRKDNSTRPYELKIDTVPGFDELRYVVVLRDISQRHERQQLEAEKAKLAQSEARFRDFAECGADWLWEVDANLRFTYMSPQVEKATGFTPEWHLGHTREELGLDDENTELMSELYEETTEIEGFNDRVQVRRRKDGGHVWIAFSGKPLTDEAGNFAGYRGVSRDVTASVVRENNLRATNAELENFAYAASHDLQEPLRKIMAFGERLTEELGEDLAPGPAMYLSRISAASGRMSTLINNLLEFSRAGRPKDPAAPVDLNVVLEQVLADQEMAVRRSDATVHADTLPVVMGHESQFYQLLGNLLGNALKFRRPDEPAEVQITTRLTDAWLIIEFRDRGIGFEDTQADRIFELFGRLHGRSKFEGTGLGLAICRKVAEFHNGRIEGKGMPGEGATFTVRLPRDLILSLEYENERVA